MVIINTLRNRKDDNGELYEVEQLSEVYEDEISCVYKDRKGVFILRSNGILIKVKHSFEQMEQFFVK